MSQDLTQKVSISMHIPDRVVHNLHQLGNSDHFVILVDIDFMAKSTNKHAYHRNVYSYNEAEWIFLVITLYRMASYIKPNYVGEDKRISWVRGDW